MRKKRRKARNPWIDIALVGGILGLIGIIVFTVLINDSSNLIHTNAKSIDSIDSNITEAESAFPGIRIISDMSNDKELPFAIQYPQTNDESFNLLVKDYIDSAKQSYIQLMLSNEQSRKDKNGSLLNELNIYFDTFQHDESYYSFIFTKRQSVRNTETETTVFTVFYNTDTHEMVDIRALLGDDSENLETFATHVRSLLKSDELLQDILIEEKANAATEPVWALFDKFSIYNDELYIYFDEGSVAKKESGLVKISVSMSFLNPLLAEDFQLEMVEVATPVETVDYNRKLVALTFDDGPHPEVTPKILEHLDRYNAKATFFMLGNRIQYYPEIAKDVLARGHEIGNHTWSHPILPKLTNEQVMSEFNTTEQVLVNATGQESTVFRPPYGSTNDTINTMIPREVVIWSIDTLDWKHRNANTLLANVQQQMHNHAIILMHDIHHSTADGVAMVLDHLSKEGYEFVTVSEILKYQQ